MAQLAICAERSWMRDRLASIVSKATNDSHTVEILDFTDLLNNSDQLAASVVLLDCSNLGQTNLSDLYQLVSTSDGLVWLMLLEEDQAQTAAVRSLWQTGQVSLLPVDADDAMLKGAIASLLCGLCVCHPDFVVEADLVSIEDIENPLVQQPLEPLTARETDVLNQLVGGLSNRAIAQKLHISEHTVKFHISAIFSKLDVTSRTAAVAVGIRNGLILL